MSETRQDRPRWRPFRLAVGALAAILAAPAQAQSPLAQGAAQSSPSDPVPAAPSPDPDLFSREKLLGDMGGLRSLLAGYGISVALTDISEVLGNTSGGIKQGATYDALTTLTVQMDTQVAFGWDGGTLNVSGLQIRGRNLSQFYLANLQTVSGIQATPTTRLWEIWYQQAFADGRYDVKFGQQSIDQEFIVSKQSALYFNTVMGWPALPTTDLYAGGPTYPLSSLGVRLRAVPTAEITLLAGVFQDNPPGGPFNNDSQLRGSTRWGGNFNLVTGALFIAEAQYAIHQPVKDEAGKATIPDGLPGIYTFGAWFDTAGFPNQRYDTLGIPLASPASNGVPQRNLHNASLYGMFDQMIWRPDSQSSSAVSVFARAMGAPDDRNLISFSVNAGVNLKAPLRDRDEDTFGVGFGVAKISRYASGFNRDTNFYGPAPFPVPIRSTETFLEVTYQIQVMPWLQVQPDFQYIFNPGGGIPNPGNPALRVKNEAVFGVRSGVTF